MSSAADICTSLRSKCTLNEFASIGRFMGCEVYEQGAGSELLLIRVPEWGDSFCSFFLLIQLGKNFKPRFKLLETSPDPSGKVEFGNILSKVLRSKEIDIGQMNTSYQFSKQNLLPEVNIEGAMHISKYHPSKFSSIVDDMFELDKRPPASIGYHSGSSSDILSKNTGKRTVSDVLKKIRILQDPEELGFIKKTKISAQASPQEDLPSNIYATLLLDVVRHCSLCIKHAKLTSQMDALNIPYFEEVALNACPNIYCCLPLAKGISWNHVILRLGKPGNTSWEVIINDQHFRDLCDLQKGNSNKNPWAPGVFVPNTSNVDSHIHFHPEGVVISYQSVEPYSIKKVVADVQRLSNARKFAIGIRKLLLDEKPKEGSEVADKLFEQMRKTFKVEAVGLTSLWFSFGSDTLARFAVHWESEKQGCTLHVSPDHIWPHTKFLEDFIDRGQVASLLDCILLTAGPLHALADATQPARAAASSVLGVGPDIVPSSLLPIDISVLLRGPHWIRIIYRKHFAIDMRCFAGDQVWLQPATPPKGGPSVGGSLPCPQFRQFIMEHVARELKDSNFSGGQQTIGLGDDGGYGGGWVPLVALTKVLRGVLKYLGALWLFAQLPELLKEILGSILEVNEGALLNLDPDQPALRFFVGDYVFAVSVHRAQLLLQMQTVKRFHHYQQQLSAAREALNKSEIDEICDYFCRHVASEPYDISRVASFITLLTLPISVLREFIKLIAWKKGISSTQTQVGDMASAQNPRVELCLRGPTVQSNIHYDRALNSVDFMLTVVLDPAHLPHMNSAGGAAWLPYCVSVSLRYFFGGYPSVSFLGMEGSHGGRACWLRIEDWKICEQRVARTVVVDGYSSAGQLSRGKLRIVADNVQRTLNSCLQGLGDGASVAT